VYGTGRVTSSKPRMVLLKERIKGAAGGRSHPATAGSVTSSKSSTHQKQHACLSLCSKPRSFMAKLVREVENMCIGA
jgi:hypothetical protein